MLIDEQGNVLQIAGTTYLKSVNNGKLPTSAISVLENNTSIRVVFVLKQKIAIPGAHCSKTAWITEKVKLQGNNRSSNVCDLIKRLSEDSCGGVFIATSSLV